MIELDPEYEARRCVGVDPDPRPSPYGRSTMTIDEMLMFERFFFRECDGGPYLTRDQVNILMAMIRSQGPWTSQIY